MVNFNDAPEKQGISNEIVRTYNEPGDRVVDHRTGEKWSYKKTVGKGNIAPIMKK